jgi:hypothetical protein
MAKDYLVLSDLIGRADFLELLCRRCERRGRLSVTRFARIRAGDIPAHDHARAGRQLPEAC